MGTKITVNGVAYDSVEAMPPEARQIYEKAMAQMPSLADRDGDGLPDVVRGHGFSVQSVVRKKFIVNGVAYDDENAMPADVRQQYEQAMKAMNSGGSGVNVKKNEIKMSFQVTGPGLKLGIGSAPNLPGVSSSTSANVPSSAPALAQAIGNMAKPIEPSTVGASLRLAISLAAALVGALVLWYWLRPH